MLYRREFPSVFRAAYLVCGDRDLAEEATQEAFARALARWRRLGAQPWVGGWITTTALNIARRQLRRRPERSADPAPAIDHAAILDLRAALRRLPARQQEAIVLHHLLDLPVAQTAAAMGCGEGAVKTHLSRARAALAQALTTDDERSGPTRSEDHG
jgi:RNA polymerase sigma-70 factor, ECF subfamily